MSLYSRAESDAQSLKVLGTTEKNSVDKYDHDNTLIVDGDSEVAGAQGYATAARRVIYIDDVEATLSENRERGLTAPGWWEYFTYTDASGNTRHKAQHLVAFKDAPANTADADDSVAADVASAISISAQPANQSTFTPAGGILTIDTIGAAVATRPAGTYTIGASDYTTDAAGTGATFTITVDGTGAATIDSIDAAGSGFVVDETFTILGSVFDNGTDPAGTDGVDDLTFDAATVAAAAATFTITASADAGSVVYQWQVQAATGTRWTNVSGANSASLALTGLTTADTGKKYRVKLTSSAGAEEVISDAATLTVTAA
ncbi:virion structural protein [Synechococcus phage S-PM2]|uniref:Virion structural protein n=1 Tax=Synechococcus phage S-PM2 TaxID=238854 RepID=Q5GQJ2_BPSYP|nr:head protein [Synechococcus phage S-PM2]CAF34210.1 virion structural protein [Synechococcus phage S-PM2]CFW42334.1 virion structural protein [Synechococcus phage S-PM2]